MLMLSHRLQILLDDERHARLTAAADRRGVPVAVIVREALDAALPGGEAARADAARRILEAEPMAVPDPEALRGELDELPLAPGVIVLDTTVLVYAVGGPHPLAAPARGLVSAIRDGRVRATTTVEAVQEFAHIRARRRGRADAAALARDYARLLSPLLSPSEDDLDDGLDLFEEGHLGAFDAVLAAVAHGRGAEALVSADQAFGAAARVRVMPLDGPGVAELIG